MARRSIWNGAISFGMVVIPVKMYPATDSKDISFVNLHSTCQNRIRQPRYCPHHDTTVEPAEIVRAYEYAKDQYIIMEDADFEELPVPSKHNIEITRFVDLTSIDPIYFEKSYAIEPQEIGIKPFYLLKQALESTGRVAVAQVSIRQKETLCCLRPFDQGFMMETMHYPAEIKGMDELNLPEDEAKVTEQEMSMAIALVDQLTGPFEPEDYEDDYRIALEKVIEAKLVGGEPVKVAAVAPQGKVGDLMDALKASIEATKAERSDKKPVKSKASAKKSTVDAAASPTAKRTPVKAATKGA